MILVLEPLGTYQSRVFFLCPHVQDMADMKSPGLETEAFPQRACSVRREFLVSCISIVKQAGDAADVLDKSHHMRSTKIPGQIRETRLTGS